MSKVQVKHNFKFPRETLFDAFTSKESIQEFLFRTETGKVIEAHVEPEAGGSFSLVEDRNGQLAGHYGTFVEFDRPEKISFVFAVDKNSDPASFTEIFFNSITGGTEISLTQEIPEEYVAWETKIKNGWSSILEGLEKYALKQALSDSIPKDSNGQALSEGDSVKVIKDLNVKGSSMVVKRGTIVKKIHLISGNDTEIDCKVDNVGLALETRWLVKV